MNPKQAAAEKAVEYVKDGHVVGLGTGSTAAFAVRKLGEKVKDGLRLIGIPTSLETERLAKELNIPLSTLDKHSEIDITVDGADEVDPELNLIKGMGGALLREKVVASVTKKEIIIVDDSKLVDVLGTRSPLPVEVVPFGVATARKELEGFGCRVELRMSGDGPYLTDNGNNILLCRFNAIRKPGELELEINSIPGVIENGLFIGLADTVIVGSGKGLREIRKR